jgi:hypothetical protein
MEEVERLGYYAKHRNNNLFQFKWSTDDTFRILINNQWEVADPKEYEILEIGYFVSK